MGGTANVCNCPQRRDPHGGSATGTVRCCLRTKTPPYRTQCCSVQSSIREGAVSMRLVPQQGGCREALPMRRTHPNARAPPPRGLLFVLVVCVCGSFAMYVNLMETRPARRTLIRHRDPSSTPQPSSPLTMQSIQGLQTQYRVVRAGAGRAVEKGNTVTVHATGTVKETQKKFWSTKDPGQQPFQYQAGVGGVIKGWDQGCLGMQENEVRQIVIPAAEGYGAGGFPAWGIPAGATLDFEIEILKIN